MKLSAGNDNTTTLPDSQTESGSDVRHGRAVHVSRALSAEILQLIAEACQREAAEHRRAEQAELISKRRNDNVTAKRRRENLRLGRQWSSQVRRLKRAYDIGRREALAYIARENGIPASDVETLCRLFGRRRDERVQRMRLDALARYSAAGMSKRAMAERLNVTPQHVGRLLENINLGVREA